MKDFGANDSLVDKPNSRKDDGRVYILCEVTIYTFMVHLEIDSMIETTSTVYAAHHTVIQTGHRFGPL